MMALKIVSIGGEALSGVRRNVIEQLQAMLARGIYPFVAILNRTSKVTKR